MAQIKAIVFYVNRDFYIYFQCTLNLEIVKAIYFLIIYSACTL